MKKLVNLSDPNIVLIVKDVHSNGHFLVCDTGDDIFDLWCSSWEIVDIKNVSK